MATNLITTRASILNGSVIDATQTSKIYDVLISGSKNTSDNSIFGGIKIYDNTIITKNC